MQLLDLPDVPLLQVLSQLAPKHLFAAGRTCLRLAALARTLPWRDQGEIRLKKIADVRDLLRVAAPPERLCILDDLAKPDFVFCAGRGCFSFDCLGDSRTHNTCPPRSLQVNLSRRVSFEDALRLIREVAPLAKGLAFAIEWLSVIYRVMEDASWLKLEHLTFLQLNLHDEPTALWPQELVLPSLRCVSVDAADDVDNYVPYFEESLESLRSLLRPHSEQLSRVTIDSGEQKLLEHIVSALPSDLRRLEIHLLREGEAAALQQIHGLKELVLDNWETEWDEESLRQTCSELDHFLRSPGPLERLGLPGDAIPMGALGAGGLKSLQCLLLDGTYPLYELPDQDLRRWPEGFVRELPAALAGLPRLRVLILCSPPPGVFQNIAPGDVAALEVVVVVDLESCSTSPCQCRQSPVFRTRTRECARAPQMASELQSLVRRLPAPLHAIYGYQNMFFRHPVSETAGCSLCAEASTEAVAALHEYEDRPHMRLDGTVKCVRV
ncbi:hypothetical protein FOCC_FOCC003885 [Frankliniella occidentalis]|nr:hypothetical protein FOCC_FOCC003885 [Frankliniella occidentalis]